MITVLSLVLSGRATAADEVLTLSGDGAHGFGIGAVVGEPTGLTMAVRPNDYNAVQAHLSWSVVHDFAQGSADYLQTVVLIDPDGSADLPITVGIGGVLGVTGDPPGDTSSPWLGVRIPIGLAVLPDRAPIEVFGEVVPTVFLLPSTTPGLAGDLGARVYF